MPSFQEGKKKVLFASKRIKQFYSTELERQSPCCWVCSNSEPETSYQSLGQKANGQLLLGNHRIPASLGPPLPMPISQWQTHGEAGLDTGPADQPPESDSSSHTFLLTCHANVSSLQAKASPSAHCPN